MVRVAEDESAKNPRAELFICHICPFDKTTRDASNEPFRTCRRDSGGGMILFSVFWVLLEEYVLIDVY